MGQYIDKEGRIQYTLDLGANDHLNGRNLQTEQANAPKQRKPRPTGLKYQTKAIKANGGIDPKQGIQKKLFECLERRVSEACIQDIFNRVERILWQD